MSETKAKPSFRKGAEEARDASKGGAQFARNHFFQLDSDTSKPENTALARFITDQPYWIVVDQHQAISTRPAPKDYPKDAKWPDKMSGVCRNDRAFDGMFDDCFICEHMVGKNGVKKPSARVWALACLREEVRDGGKIIGYRDLTREVAITDDKGEPTGETIKEKAIVIVNMGFKNFFSILEGFAGRYDTVLDRDYFIKRIGDGMETTYQIAPETPILMDDKGTVFDLRDPEIAKRYEYTSTLEEIVFERASDDFYARFFDIRVAAPATQTGVGSSTSKDVEVPEAPSNDVPVERMQALAERVKGLGKPAAQAEPEVVAEVAAEPESEAPKAKAAAGPRNLD